MAAQVTDAGFDAEVLKCDLPVLVDFWAPWCHHAAQRLAAGMPGILRPEYAGRIRRSCGSDGALAGGAGERYYHAHTAVYVVIFRFIITGLARFLRQTDAKPIRLSRCVYRGCGRDVFRHWSSNLGRFT